MPQHGGGVAEQVRVCPRKPSLSGDATELVSDVVGERSACAAEEDVADIAACRSTHA